MTSVPVLLLLSPSLHQKEGQTDPDADPGFFLGGGVSATVACWGSDWLSGKGLEMIWVQTLN